MERYFLDVYVDEQGDELKAARSLKIEKKEIFHLHPCFRVFKFLPM